MTILETIKKHAGKYIGITSISSLISLGMTKYYTAVLDPVDFGVLSLYIIMFQYIGVFVSCDVYSGVVRLYFEFKDKKEEYISTIFCFITIMSILIFCTSLIFMPFISSYISYGSERVYFATVMAGIFSVYSSLLIKILYIEEKSTDVFKYAFFQVITNHFSSVVFMSLFKFSIMGRMLGQGLAYLLTFIVLLLEFRRKKFLKLKIFLNKTMLFSTLKLSIPTMVTSIQGILFVYLDRVFIKNYLGDASVGIYALGFMLGQSMSMIYEAITQAILPKIYKDMTIDYEKSLKELEIFSYKYYFLLLIMSIVISGLSSFIVKIFANDSYIEAASVMPFIILGFTVAGFYKIPAIVLGFNKVVRIYPFVSFLSFIVNILLNWTLIPIYGIFGAALSSFVAFFVYSLSLFLFCMKFMSKKFNYLSIILLLLIFCLTCTGAFFGKNFS
ncbi:oligosaccharide flippase family protein [Campylobacter sp. MOP51]|uniref:oligosaccharide flippase family protein n=1 Tax=Campylobacter canis TaxID=3378588 RepID=UPI003C35D554